MRLTPVFRRTPRSDWRVLVRGLLARPGVLRGCAVCMPGKSHAGPLPPLTPAQRELALRLKDDVSTLAIDFEHRNVGSPGVYTRARCWLADRLGVLDRPVERQMYRVSGVDCANLWIDLSGSSHERDVVVVGAHYDAIEGSPAANDNATGVAAVLDLAAHFAALPQAQRPRYTLRFCLFANEEPPYFWTDNMGSVRLARHFRGRGDAMRCMITPETIGYYSDAPGSQHCPGPFGGLYPTTGNFIAFIGLAGSHRLVRRCVRAFRTHAPFPSQGACLPGLVPGVGSSDHWSFWREGVPSLMVTDTAPFRYPHYHTPLDTPDKIDFERTARVVEGLRAVVRDCADEV